MAKITVYNSKGMKALTGNPVEGLKVGVSTEVDDILGRLNELDNLAKKAEEGAEFTGDDEVASLFDRLHSFDIVVDGDAEFRETPHGMELLLRRNEKIDLVIDNEFMNGEGGEEAKAIYRDLLIGGRLTKPRPIEKVEPLTEEQIVKARGLIEKLRDMAEKAVNTYQEGDILDFVYAVEKYIEEEYSIENVKAFKKALKKAKDANVFTVLSLFDSLKSSLTNIPKGLWSFLTHVDEEDVYPGSIRRLGDVVDLDESLLLLKRKKIEVFGEIGRDLDGFFEDRVTADETDFKMKKRKNVGSMEGYIAAKKTDEDGLPFMMKITSKAVDSVIPDEFVSEEDRKKKKHERANFINECVVAPLYKRTLYDRAPVVSLVDSKKTGMISLRSKFLHNFRTVNQYAGFIFGEKVIRNFDKLRQVEGAEKVFASILFWGEFDFNVNNLGVMKIVDGSGEEKHVFAKIDHGLSAAKFCASPNNALAFLKADCKRLGYSRFVEEEQQQYELAIQFNVNKLKESIDQLLLVSEVGETGVTIKDEVETIVKSRIFQLRWKEVEIEGQEFPIHSFVAGDLTTEYYKVELSEDQKRKLSEIEDEDGEGIRRKKEEEMFFENLENFYIDRFRTQIQIMRKLSKKLEIISKIDFSDSVEEQAAWENGGWFEEVTNDDNSIVHNPIDWARRNGKKIDGLAAEEYEEQNPEEGEEEEAVVRLRF